MSRLELFFLGSPRMVLDGAAVEVDTRKATALMAYLAATGTAHSRDTLAVLLWPDYDQAHARAALRRTLSTLNRALGPESSTWLDIEREQVRLNTAAKSLWSDIDE